jgi:transcriptional regulator with XRE-family HTH domain
MTSLTPAQSRAARGLLEWSQSELAARSNLSESTVRDFEKGRRLPTINNLDAVRRALEAAGVEFIAENGGGPGVRLKKRAKGVEEISQQIDALEDKISSIPAPTEPSPEAAMNTMRKAVAESDLTKLKTRRKRIKNNGSK